MAQDGRLIAAVALRPNPFDGLKPEKSKQWWKSFERFADFSNIDGENKARLLGMMLKGIALLWYE
jgi:hypothetical protein